MRKPGRQKKTPGDVFRAMSFYFATQAEAEAEFQRKITPADLNRLFPLDKGKATDKGPWYRYRSGETLPGKGTYKNAEANLLRDVGLRYPAAPLWLNKPLWVFSDLRELTLPQIHAWMLELSPAVKIMLMGELVDGTYCRWYSGPQFEVDVLVEHGSIDDLAALIALIREADLLQSLQGHNIAFEGMCALLPLLEKEPATAPFAAEFSAYVKKVFQPMWALVPGLYHQHPSKEPATYRGALNIPAQE